MRFDMGCQVPHDAGSRGNLVHGLAFHAQADQEATDLCGRRFPGHDLLHHRAHVIA